MKQKDYKVNKVMRAAAVLLCLNLVVTYLLSGMMARFTSTAAAEDSARVADFYVDERMLQNGTETQSFAVMLTPEDTQECTIQVTNNSETSVHCSLTAQIENQINIPMVISFENDKATANLDPNGASQEFVIRVNWQEDYRYIENFMYHGMVDNLLITLNCAQID